MTAILRGFATTLSFRSGERILWEMLSLSAAGGPHKHDRQVELASWNGQLTQPTRSMRKLWAVSRFGCPPKTWNTFQSTAAVVKTRRRRRERGAPAFDFARV